MTEDKMNLPLNGKPISIAQPPALTNLQVLDDAQKLLLNVCSDGTTTFDWPLIRAFLEAHKGKPPTTVSFVCQAVHAAWVEGIAQQGHANAELAERCLKHADILTADNWHTEAATLREAAAILAEVPK